MFVHSSRIKKQIEYLTLKGIKTKQLLKQAGFTPEEVLDPEKLFSLEQFQQVLEFGMKETGDEFYGLHFGQEPHIAGTIGMLCASCRNLKEAFIQGCKFFKIQGDFAEITFVENKHYPKIVYEINDAWLMNSPVSACQEVDGMFAFLAVILKINSNSLVKPFKVNLKCKRPGTVEEYEKAFGIIPRFRQEKNEMIFRETDLMIPMKAFNPETFRLLKNHFDFLLNKRRQEESVTERVKSVLLSTITYQFPSMETVASKLKISRRTLQRQLSGEKTSFKNILQETKFELAKKLLQQKQLTISEISYMLGYSDLGNFSRSFKKFTGSSPQEYRNSIS